MINRFYVKLIKKLCTIGEQKVEKENNEENRTNDARGSRNSC